MGSQIENSGNSPVSSESEEEEQDDSSSNEQKTVEDVLAAFRQKWQQELSTSSKRQTINQNSNYANNAFEDISSEKNAEKLFLKGIEMERAGELYQAIRYYRRAVQIDPDIEFKVSFTSKRQGEEDIKEVTEQGSVEVIDDSDSENEVIEDGQLLSHIQRRFNKIAPLCRPKFNQDTLHISALPVEIILYILRWLVSSDLDLKALETFGMVCRGFYLCARDPEIWHLACLRVWGLSCGPSPGIFGSWRDMFLEKARINFNGCYISRTTYVRHGENSFQDQFYRPWHLVSYYRCLRFFPEGLVLMLTSSDEPSKCVSQMRSRGARQPVMMGYYRLKDDKVTLVVHRQENKAQGYKKHRKRNLHENAEQTFHMELQIKNHRNKRHVQLIWTHYSLYTKTMKGDESNCVFDLVANRFPPLWFSRVKSYTTESEFPLT